MQKQKIFFILCGVLVSSFLSLEASGCSRPNITGSCIPKKYQCTKEKTTCCFHGFSRLWIGANGQYTSQIQMPTMNLAVEPTRNSSNNVMDAIAIEPMSYCSSD